MSTRAFTLQDIIGILNLDAGTVVDTGSTELTNTFYQAAEILQIVPVWSTPTIWTPIAARYGPVPSTNLNNSVLANAGTITFTSAPSGFTNGQSVVLEPGTPFPIMSGFGTTRFTGSLVAGQTFGNLPCSATPFFIPNGATVTMVSPQLASPYQRTVLADNPAGYWRLGDLPATYGSSTVADFTGHLLTGTFTSGGSPSQFGGPPIGITMGSRPGATAAVDTNPYMGFSNTAGVVVADNPLLHPGGAMSLEAWAYKTIDSSFQRIASGGSFPNQAYYIQADNTGQMFGNVGGVSVNFGVMPLNAWTHYVLTYDGSTLRGYVNGVQVASAPLTGGVPTGSGGFGIGADPGNFSFWNGRLDDVALYSYALSAAQVLKHYQIAQGIVTLAPSTTSMSFTVSPAVAAGATSIAFAGTATANGTYPPGTVLTYVSANQEVVVLSSGAGTTTWTLGSNTQFAHAAGINIYGICGTYGFSTYSA